MIEQLKMMIKEIRAKETYLQLQTYVYMYESEWEQAETLKWKQLD